MQFPHWLLLSFLPLKLLAAAGDENWETFSIPKGLNGPAVRLLSFQDSLYAAGDFTEAGGQPSAGIAAWNGARWSAVGRGLEGTVLALATDGKTLYAGGSFVIPELAITNLAMWDGQRWHPIGNVIKRNPYCFPSASVYALAWQGHRLVVGGTFDMVSDLPAKNIAALHGNRWEP